MNILLMGLPGAGKGTQAVRIEQEMQIPHISTGDMFRLAVSEKTPLGIEAQRYMDRGQLVPDSVTIGIVEERLVKDDCQTGFLLDGFPRTVPQAEALDALLARTSKKIDLVIYIDVCKEQLLSRLTGRRVCRGCGKTYHLLFAPPEVEGRCNDCNSALFQRDDDREDTVAQRLKIHDELMRSLLDYYEKDQKLIRVRGEQSIEQVWLELLETIRGINHDCA